MARPPRILFFTPIPGYYKQIIFMGKDGRPRGQMGANAGKKGAPHFACLRLFLSPLSFVPRRYGVVAE
jgi:hypothetical protein